MAESTELAQYLDDLLAVATIPDYPGALNGLQLANRGPVRKVAAAVDFSRRTIEATITAQANFLIVHHGMFWGGAQRITGPTYDRLRLLLEHDVAVYACHLPLDAHLRYGNNVLLAHVLELDPTERFGSYEGAPIGVAGASDIATMTLLERADAFARPLGGSARASMFEPRRPTKRWAIVTGAGAGSREIQAARSSGIDTLIVGEGAHHTTVDAPEAGLVIIYAGHYATETLGVRALAEHIGDRFKLPHEFLFLPTGS